MIPPPVDLSTELESHNLVASFPHGEQSKRTRSTLQFLNDLVSKSHYHFSYRILVTQTSPDYLGGHCVKL